MEALMNTLTNSHGEQELTQLAARFEHWRQHHTSLAEPIPQSLWDQAVSLTTLLPRSRVARHSRVSGQALKHRCVAQPTAASARPASATDSGVSLTALDFVEVTSPSNWPLPTSSTEIELQRVDGARLRMHSHAPQFPFVGNVSNVLFLYS
jgi:hypothetical protein